MERSSMNTTPWKPKKKNDFFFFSKKFEFWLVTKSWNHLSFVSISPTLVIDTSMERSSWVLHHRNPQKLIFFLKFKFWRSTKSWNHHSFVNISPALVIDNLIHQWKGLHEYYCIETQKFELFSDKFKFWLVTKCWNHHSFVNISPTLVIDTSMERFSRVLQHGNLKIWFFFSKKFDFWLMTIWWNHLSFVNITPKLVIDTSMDRSSQVLQHGNPKIWIL